MNSQKNYQKCLLQLDANERTFDVERCIICQRQSDATVTSTKNGRQKIIDVVAV